MPIPDSGARRIFWPDCSNVRDLGGLPTVDGSVTRCGALIRADSLDRLTKEGIDALREAGVSRILDLRGRDEARAQPHPFAGEEIYQLVPMVDPRRLPGREVLAGETLAMIYSNGLDRNAGRIVDCLAAIADAPEGAVVVHCAVGKDRTGTIVALSLSLAGVPDQVIAEDYAFSDVCLREEFDRIAAGVTDEGERAHVLERMGCLPETILAMLDRARESYGDVEGYVLTHGFGPDRLKRLRARLRADS